MMNGPGGRDDVSGTEGRGGEDPVPKFRSYACKRGAAISQSPGRKLDCVRDMWESDREALRPRCGDRRRR